LIERRKIVAARRIWILIVGVVTLAACQPVSPSQAEEAGTAAPEYPAQFYVVEVPATAEAEKTTRKVSGSVRGWFACTNGASLVPPFVWLVSKVGNLEYKDYQVRDYIFEDVHQGAYDLHVGCYMVTPVYTYEIVVGRGDLEIEIELPFETPADVFEVYGCLDCPATPIP
jgi:hypothetical protein